MAAPKRPRTPLYVVAVDGSPHASKAADTAVEFAARAGATLLIITVVDLQGPHPHPHALPHERKAAERLVAEEARRALEEGVAARTEVLEGHSAAQAIVKDAQRAKADLVVVGSRGAAGIRRVLLGSVAAEVVRLAHCPVMVVR